MARLTLNRTRMAPRAMDIAILLVILGFLILTACTHSVIPTPSPPAPQPAPVPAPQPSPATPIPHADPAPTPPPTPPPVPPAPTMRQNPADLIFFDSFEYAVGRNDPNAAKLFMQHGHWSGVKTMQSDRPGARGYLYTVEKIPGHAGAFPNGSNRVLAIEALPATHGLQTDVYLRYGSPDAPAETVPGNVWFQFWMFINHSRNQPSRVDAGNKFLYVCNGHYPCHTEKWLIGFGSSSQLPHWQSLGVPSDGDAFLRNTLNADTAEIVNTHAPAYDRQKLGQRNIKKYIAANKWTLIKIHLDTSTESGKYEAWMRPLGGGWTKVAEWIDGVTPGFTWKIHSKHIGGHRVLSMPTTIGNAIASRGLYDSWIYLDDFAMARSEAGLPQYHH